MPSRKRHQQLALIRLRASAQRWRTSGATTSVSSTEPAMEELRTPTPTTTVSVPSIEPAMEEVVMSTPTTTTSVSSTEPTVEEVLIPTPVSASKRKLEYFSNDSISSDTAEHPHPTLIVDFSLLQTLFVSLLCPFCCTESLELLTSSKNTGLSTFLRVFCINCQKDITSSSSSKKLPDSSFDINRRVVAASLAVGISQEGLGKFSEIVGINKIHHKTYSTHVDKIHTKIGQFKKCILGKAVEKVREVHDVPQGTLDIDVSYDGSWHTRGHKSQSGIGCVIENSSGLVVDYHVMSRFCQICSVTGDKLKKESPDQYSVWFENHKENCLKNHDGSAGSMEQTGAVTLWSRSMEYSDLRYRSVVSDGDTNTIKELLKLDPYVDLKVEKLECVNHVSKRVGKALRNLVEVKRKQKITLGGKKKGQLTDKKISKLQKYYRKAVLSNSTVANMKSAIWATYYHCISTDENPQHDNCPPGTNSYCFVQRAIARNQDIPPHTPSNQKTYLNENVSCHVKEVFQRLTEDDLLVRCLQGKTQNANESIHSTIWARCPKHIFVQKKRLDIAVSVGVAEFNMGSKGTQYFLKEIGLEVRGEAERLGERRDERRVRKAEKSVCDDMKRRRIIIRNARMAELQEIEEREGGPQYESGGF